MPRTWQSVTKYLQKYREWGRRKSNPGVGTGDPHTSFKLQAREVPRVFYTFPLSWTLPNTPRWWFSIFVHFQYLNPLYLISKHFPSSLKNVTGYIFLKYIKTIYNGCVCSKMWNTHLPPILQSEKQTITITWKPGCEPSSKTAHSHHTCSFLGHQYPGFCTVCLILLFQQLCIIKNAWFI